MIKTEDIYEVVTQTVDITGIYGDVRFRGNVAYGKVLGFGITKMYYLSGTPEVLSNHTVFTKVGAKESGGGNRTILAPIPFEYLEMSKDVPFNERFIPVNDVDANLSDFVVNVEFAHAAAQDSQTGVRVQVTVIYSKSTK